MRADAERDDSVLFWEYLKSPNTIVFRNPLRESPELSPELDFSQTEEVEPDSIDPLRQQYEEDRRRFGEQLTPLGYNLYTSREGASRFEEALAAEAIRQGGWIDQQVEAYNENNPPMQEVEESGTQESSPDNPPDERPTA